MVPIPWRDVGLAVRHGGPRCDDTARVLSLRHGFFIQSTRRREQTWFSSRAQTARCRALTSTAPLFLRKWTSRGPRNDTCSGVFSSRPGWDDKPRGVLAVGGSSLARAPLATCCRCQADVLPTHVRTHARTHALLPISYLLLVPVWLWLCGALSRFIWDLRLHADLPRSLATTGTCTSRMKARLSILSSGAMSLLQPFFSASASASASAPEGDGGVHMDPLEEVPSRRNKVTNSHRSCSSRACHSAQTTQQAGPCPTRRRTAVHLVEPPRDM